MSTGQTQTAEVPKDLQSPMSLMEELAQSPEMKGSTPIPSKATMLFVGAMSSIAKKNFEDASKKLHQAVLEGEKEVHKEPHAIALCGLGYLYSAYGQWDKAVPCYADSVAQWETIHGKENPKMARILADTASVHEHAGLFEKAEAYLTRAVHAVQKAKGEKSPEAQGLICGLGNLMIKLGRFDDAEKHFNSAVANLMDPLHPSVTFALKLLHNLLVQRGKTEEAAKVDAEMHKLKEEFAHKSKK